MSRRFYFPVLLALVILTVSVSTAFAQTAPISGTVELLKADGTKEPIAGAVVEIYRTDIKSGAQTSKTGKRGDFVFAGVLYGGTFAIAVSAPGASPTVYPGVKAGQEKLVITLNPGDGRKLTEAEVRSGASASTASSGGKLTAEQEKEKAEYDKKVAEVNAKNEKAQKANDIIAQSVKAGKEAFELKNYDLAISKYEEGIAADPDFIGSAPVLNNNRSIALRVRAVDRRNKAITITDATEKVTALGAARKDLADSAAGFLRSWTIIKGAPATEVTDKAAFDAVKASTLVGAVDTYKMAVRTELVDPSVIEAAKVMMPEYLASETDAAKKNEANLVYADLFRVSGDSANAVDAYKKILETAPDNADALAGAGLSLFNLGYEKNSDKALFQEGANYLQKFVSVAPDTHRYKKDAMDVLDNLKKEQNVTPQKSASPKRKT